MRVLLLVSLAVLTAVCLTGCGGGGSDARYIVRAASMEPTLHCAEPSPGCEASEADEFVVEETTRFQQQDIVLFETPASAQTRCGVSGKFVSRVIGMPGDTIEIRSRDGAEGYVYVNGMLLDEPYLSSEMRATEPGRYAVPRSSYFVMGDARPISCDSRVFGPVPADNMIGTVAKVT